MEGREEDDDNESTVDVDENEEEVQDVTSMEKSRQGRVQNAKLKLSTPLKKVTAAEHTAHVLEVGKAGMYCIVL